MTRDEFQALAHKSACIYYDYLKAHNLGLSEEMPRRITRNSPYISLYLLRRLPVPDSVYFRIHGVDYSQDEVGKCVYDDKARRLTIAPSDNFAELFASLTVDDILVVSDLKFLVERVRDWYMNRQVIPPSALLYPSKLDYTAPGIEPSDEQRAALDNIFSHNFSYVWGIPGSGKTSVVLSLAVLAYVRAGKRVLIAAPTNNAIEQTLRGVIPVLDRCGIDRNLVFRMGIASAHFQEEFPEVCEIPHVEQEYSRLTDERGNLAKYLRLLEYREFFEAAKVFLPKLLDELAEIALTEEDLRKKKKALDNQSDGLSSKNQWIAMEQHRAKLDLEAGQKQLSDLISRQDSMIYKIRKALHMQSAQRLDEQILNTRSKISSLGHSISNYDVELQKIAQEGILVQSEIDGLDLKLSALPKAEELLSHAENISSFDKALCNHIRDLKGKYNKLVRRRIDKELMQIEIMLQNELSQYTSYSTLSQEELKHRYDGICAKLDKVIPGSAEDRMSKCLVLAATLDKVIYSVKPEDYQPVHVFLDEAAYAPLIKGATLTSFGSPLTLLGDHMQLPPVCEMKDEQLKAEDHLPITLWSQSVIYLADIFNEMFDYFLASYFSFRPPNLTHLNTAFLSKSYRFSNALALLLSEHIYGIPLYGTRETDTAIVLLDARKCKGDHFHESHGEAKAIKDMVLTDIDADYAVLTPYRKQRALLVKVIPADHVYTIHGSQGQEWNTVYISIANPKPWQFTDSTQLIGKRVLNTAISRVKHKLVLVCDLSSWNGYPEQFITQMANLSEPTPASAG